MNKVQAKRIKQIVSVLTADRFAPKIESSEATLIGDTIVFFVSLKARGEGTMLEISDLIEGLTFLATIGPRGAVLVKAAPKSWHKYAGKRLWGYGWKIDKNVR